MKDNVYLNMFHTEIMHKIAITMAQEKRLL